MYFSPRIFATFIFVFIILISSANQASFAQSFSSSYRPFVFLLSCLFYLTADLPSPTYLSSKFEVAATTTHTVQLIQELSGNYYYYNHDMELNQIITITVGRDLNIKRFLLYQDAEQQRRAQKASFQRNSSSITSNIFEVQLIYASKVQRMKNFHLLQQ